MKCWHCDGELVAVVRERELMLGCPKCGHVFRNGVTVIRTRRIVEVDRRKPVRWWQRALRALHV